jgi:Flp pilus assembly pilin Flp
MTALLTKLWQDEKGGLLAAEYLILGTLLTIGLLVGIYSVQASLLEKLQQLAQLVSS